LDLFAENAIFTAVVNKHDFVNLEGPFEAEALRILREIPGLTVISESPRRDGRGDAILRFADRRARIAIEFKRRANAATAWQLVHQARTLPKMPLLLIAGDTTTEAREILRQHRIAVIDGLGNAHIEIPGLLLHLEGHRRRRSDTVTKPPTRLSGKAGVVAQALLVDMDRAWRVQELAGAGQVSASLAHRVLMRLEHEGIVMPEGKGPKRVRRITNRTALLDLWAEEQHERPSRTPGYLLAQTPQQLIERLGSHLRRAGIDYALTGAAGASLVAPFVTAIPVVDIWVTATAGAEELYAGARVRPVTEGQNVVFLQAKDDTPLAFREQVNGLWVTNRFRLYADLRLDPRRGREQAEHLRREVIGF